jgi:hypothetical protein
MNSTEDTVDILANLLKNKKLYELKISLNSEEYKSLLIVSSVKLDEIQDLLEHEKLSYISDNFQKHYEYITMQYCLNKSTMHGYSSLIFIIIVGKEEYKKFIKTSPEATKINYDKCLWLSSEQNDEFIKNVEELLYPTTCKPAKR